MIVGNELGNADSDACELAGDEGSKGSFAGLFQVYYTTDEGGLEQQDGYGNDKNLYIEMWYRPIRSATDYQEKYGKVAIKKLPMRLCRHPCIETSSSQDAQT